MPKSIMSRFKTYSYNRCDDLKNLSGRDIIRLNPSIVNWDIKTNKSTYKCNPEQQYALDYLMDLKKIKKGMAPQKYATEVNDALVGFTEALVGASDASFRDAARKVKSDIQQRKTSKNVGKGNRRRYNRNTKKKRKYKKHN